MAYEAEYKQIIDVLERASFDLDQINNPDLVQLLDRIKGDLKNHSNFLNVQLGNNVVGESPVSRAVGGGKLRKMLGRELPVVPVKVASPVLDTDSLTFKEFQARQKERSQDPEVEAFRARLNELYPVFRNMETPVILDQLNETEIRGIGKWAGLPVSEFSPKEVDAKFVEQIKQAMDKKAELEENKDNKSNDSEKVQL